jgi:hypothetical protein
MPYEGRYKSILDRNLGQKSATRTAIAKWGNLGI